LLAAACEDRNSARPELEAMDSILASLHWILRRPSLARDWTLAEIERKINALLIIHARGGGTAHVRSLQVRPVRLAPTLEEMDAMTGALRKSSIH